MNRVGGLKRWSIMAVAVPTILTGAACSARDGDDRRATEPSARAVVSAFQAAGLPADNPRDNTAFCTFDTAPARSCDELVTTDQVSVYLWPTSEAATQFGRGASCESPDAANTAGARCSERVGRYLIVVGNDSDFPVPEAAPYVATARSLIEETAP